MVLSMSIQCDRHSFFSEVLPCSLYTVQSYNFCIPCRSLFLEEFPTFTGEGFDQVLHHTGQCKITGGCHNELVVAIFRTGAGVKGKKSIPVDSINSK